MHKDKLQKERMKEFRQKCVSWKWKGLCYTMFEEIQREEDRYG